MSPSLTIAGIDFYDAPSEIEGSPYWVDLWADVNGYKMGLQVKPPSYNAASASFFMGGARSSEEKGHRLFQQHFGGKVFIVTPVQGSISFQKEKQIRDEYDRLMTLPEPE